MNAEDRPQAAHGPAGDPWQPGMVVSRYTLIRRLGHGGMGEVFLAADPVLQRQVAIKRLSDRGDGNDAARRRLLHEARAAASIDHPYVCKIYEVGEASGVDFMAMEFVAGDTVRDRLAQGPMPVTTALQVALEVAEGLAHAHASGVVHRDLKPANIMTTRDGHVKVMDFGVARRLATPDGQTRQVAAATAAGMIAGTLEYMAPEQLRGEAVEPSADLFSLGLVLYEMIAGVHPFTRPSSIEMAAAILNEVPPPLPALSAVPPAVSAVVTRLLAQSPAGRFATADEACRALQALLRRDSTAAAWMPPPARRSRMWFAIAAGVIAAAVGAGAMWMQRNRAPGASIAVASIVAMPTTVVGTDADGFLADAIPNTLSSRLLGLEGLETKRPPTSVELERAGGDVERFARIYGVDAYVLTSVTATESRLTLNVQVTEALTRRLRWSQSYDGTRERFTELVHQAADGVRVALRPRAPTPAERPGGLAASAVELSLQRGLHHYQLFVTRGRPADLDLASAALQEVLQLDPGRAEAAVGLALLYNAAGLTGSSSVETREQAETWARRALTIDSRASSAWAVLSELERVNPTGSYISRLDYALKGATFGARDGFAHSRLASALIVNSYTLALAASREATRADPLLPDGPLAESIALMGLGDNPGAVARIDAALTIEPDMLFGIYTKALVLNRAGRADEALGLAAGLESAAKTGQLHPELLRFLRQFVAFQNASPAGGAAALELQAALANLARGRTVFPRWEIITQGVARTFATHGMRGAALDLMADRADMRLIDPFDYLMFDPAFDSLRPDPRFGAILDRSRLRFEEMIALLDNAALRGEMPAYLDQPLRELRSKLQTPAVTR